MKRKFTIAILVALSILLCVSCNSCTSSSAQNINNTEQIDTTFIKTSDPEVVAITFDEETSDEALLKSDEASADQKRVIRKKEIQPIEVDSTWIQKSDKEMEQLQITEEKIIMQQSKIDSLLLKKNK